MKEQKRQKQVFPEWSVITDKVINNGFLVIKTFVHV